jgi:hypothetical protein
MDQNVVNHTNGAGTASNVNGSNQTGSSITVNATGAGTITKGTVVTFVGCNSVNPQNREDTGSLAQFVITADVAQGATSLPISPAIVTSGAFQNVTASPTTGQAFVIWGGFHDLRAERGVPQGRFHACDGADVRAGRG